MTPNCSSIFHHPPPTPTLRCTFQNVWWTSLLGQLCITSNSTLVKLLLNLVELLFILGKDCLCTDLSVSEDVMVLLSLTARNLGVILNDRLSCGPNITAEAQSCRFALNNICRIWFFLTKDVMQLLVQALVISSGHLIWTTAAPSWLDSQHLRLNCCSISRKLHCTDPPPPPHPWPPLASCCGLHPIQDNGADLQGQQNFTHLSPNTGQTTHSRESTLLISTSAGRLVLPSWANKAHSAKSWLFSVLAPQWWNQLLTNVRTAESVSVFQKILKTLFRLYLDPAWPPILRWGLDNYFYISFYSINGDMLWFLSCVKCTYCKLLLTKVSA